MNFLSFANFLEFPGLFLIQKMINDISTVSLLCQQVNWLARIQGERQGVAGWSGSPTANTWAAVGGREQSGSAPQSMGGGAAGGYGLAETS